jgi:uncharacterized protein with von Willebrand factor type A (vWA) domain
MSKLDKFKSAAKNNFKKAVNNFLGKETPKSAQVPQLKDEAKKHAIKGISSYEEFYLDRAASNYQDLEDVCVEGQQIVETFQPLVQDLFSSLYKHEPTINPNMYKSHSVNKQLLEEIMATEEFSEIRKYSRLDPELSAMMTSTIGKTAIEIFKREEIKKQIQEQLEKDKKEEQKQEKKEQQKQKEQDQLGQNKDGTNQEKDQKDSEPGDEAGKDGENADGDAKDKDENQKDQKGQGEANGGGNGKNDPNQEQPEQKENDQPNDSPENEENDSPNDGNDDPGESDELDEDWDSEETSEAEETSGEESESNDGQETALNLVDMQAIASELKEAAKAIMAKQVEEEKTNEIAVKSFGNEEGNLGATSIEQKKRIAERVRKSKTLWEVCQEAGRSRDIASSIRQSKTNSNRENLVDLAQGDILPNVLPSELVMMKNPKTRMAFLKKYVEKQLMMTEYEGKDDVGKGPISILLDCSGSMGGKPEFWSKGVLLAIQMIAQQDKRDLSVCYFNSGLKATFELPKGQALDVEAWMNFVEMSASGGTNFELPLQFAVEQIKKNMFMKKADILMITDGCCSVSEPFLKWFKDEQKKMDFKVLSIFIGGQYDGYGGSDILKQFSDAVVPISDISKSCEANNSLFSI